MVSVMGYTPDFAAAEIAHIKAAIKGRMAEYEHNVNYLAWAVASSPGGPHLELGVLHGGSAILAGLMRPEARLVLVDPLDGYYIREPKHARPVDPITKIEISISVLKYNLGLFDMLDRTEIHQQTSRGYLVSTPDMPIFASAYIDGCHDLYTPMFDWLYVCERMLPGGKVIFDDVDGRHPGVQQAVEYHAGNDRRYELEFRGGITAVFRRKEGIQ